jgi:hypothetical protein
MARKKAAKKKPSRRKPAPATKKVATVRRTKNRVTISYHQPEEAIPHLLNLAGDIAAKHFDKARFTAAAEDVLGTPAARDIVSSCANSTCWDCTLGDLKLDSNIFQSCVFEGIKARGYLKRRDEIPASQSTQLYTVVMAIDDAPRAGAGT